jgi:hypothetical protein
MLDIKLLSSLEGVTWSSFGAVPNGDADIAEDARVMNDISVNDHDLQS